MIAFIAQFESHVAGQFALHDHVPLVNQRIAEIAERRRSETGAGSVKTLVGYPPVRPLGK